MDILKHEKAIFEKNGLVIHDSITVDEWKNLGLSLKQVEGCVQFWIGDWARYGEKRGFTGKYTDSKVYDELEEITGLQRDTIQKFKSVSDRVESGIRIPDLTFNHHREVASLPPEKQQEYLNEASENKWSVRELRNKVRNSNIISNDNPELPKGLYKVFYVDPPWSYNDKQNTEMLGGAEKHYPTMTIEQLCNMPVTDITADNAVLFMWVTSPLLEDSFKVINAWGFKYKASFVWDKVKHNMGHYNSVRHEFLLICTKGSCTPEVVKLYDSVVSVERSDKHSEKPIEFRQIIDTLYPSGNRVELFARSTFENWETWGNEI